MDTSSKLEFKKINLTIDNMAYCCKCGTQLSDGAKFCPKCGTASGMNKPSEGNSDVTSRYSVVQNPTDATTIQKKSKKMGCWSYGFIALLFFGFIGFLQDKCEGEEPKASDTQTQQSTGQIAKDNGESNQSKKQEEAHHDFFENGYKYSTTFRVNRKQGWGISCNYKYIIKIYNDGTKEISSANQTDDGSPATQGTHSCTIDKKSESYKDVYATWYEIKFESGYSYGGKYHVSDNKLYVDENGNVIMLGENGNNKNIYEAISTKDCIFGKFSKEKLTKEVYKCRTCGEEFDPSKEPIYSEDYCYEDYPQTCKYCGKSFTIRNEGSGACKEVCASCYHRRQSVKIYEESTGRKIY